jgi:GTPase SAR1 family protein
MSKEIPSGIYQIKTVFLGAAGVGKSSIALRFVREDFFPAVEGTIGGKYSYFIFFRNATGIICYIPLLFISTVHLYK